MTEGSINVFLSYSRKDKDLLDKLIIHLAALRRTGKITTWHDRDIEAGSEWEPEIQRHLDTADIIVLLISADFINSEYCYGRELQRAMEQHNRKEARVIPVILRPCDWKIPEIPFSKLNALPSDAEPIASSRWQYLDEAFAIVARGIREASEQLKKAKPSPKEQITTPLQQSPTAPALPKQQQPQPSKQNEIASEKGINYERLRDLLAAGQWQEADQETLKVMLKAANRENDGWLDTDDLKNFPCQDLKTIDQLWVSASKGHFGFSVQKKIWEKCGSPKPDNNDWKKFGDAVGWCAQGGWLNYSELKFAPAPDGFSPKGELLKVVYRGRRFGGNGVRLRGQEFVGQIVLSLLSRKDL